MDVLDGLIGGGMAPDIITRFDNAQLLQSSPDVWQVSGGTTEMVEFRTNSTSCTVEDIFGSRGAFVAMLGNDEDPIQSDKSLPENVPNVENTRDR